MDWIWGSWGSSDEESTEKGWKSVKRIFEDPSWVGGGGVEEHHIRTAFKNGKQVAECKK
jgi:hypothetical protein